MTGSGCTAKGPVGEVASASAWLRTPRAPSRLSPLTIISPVPSGARVTAGFTVSVWIGPAGSTIGASRRCQGPSREAATATPVRWALRTLIQEPCA